jgi:hypothetical protein
MSLLLSTIFSAQVAFNHLASKQLAPCGSFRESKEKKLRLDDVARRTFIMTLEFCCGRWNGQEMELCGVQEQTSMADRFQITEAVS